MHHLKTVHVPIHAMTDEDKEFHRHNLCLTCDGEAED
jgi:hypothetical protein